MSARSKPSARKMVVIGQRVAARPWTFPIRAGTSILRDGEVFLIGALSGG